MNNPPHNLIFRRHLRINQTKAERTLWSCLRKKQLLNLKFYRQFAISSFILDFYCHSIKLAIELDGGHHAELENLKKDKHKENFLNLNGIVLLRFWNNEVMQNLEGVYSKIYDVCRNRIEEFSLRPELSPPLS